MMSRIFIDTQLQNTYTPTHKKELFANRNSHAKSGLLLTLKGSLISHGAHRALRESGFSHDTQEIAYLAPLGRAITLRGIVYGKGSKRKKEECILFSLKTFSHKSVSNHSVVTLLRGLCGLEHSWLQECGREIKG